MQGNKSWAMQVIPFRTGSATAHQERKKPDRNARDELGKGTQQINQPRKNEWRGGLDTDETRRWGEMRWDMMRWEEIARRKSMKNKLKVGQNDPRIFAFLCKSNGNYRAFLPQKVLPQTPTFAQTPHMRIQIALPWSASKNQMCKWGFGERSILESQQLSF